MSLPASSPTMIGRDRDLDVLLGELAGALGNSPRGVVVGGEAGIGKTRLLREFVAQAARSSLVLTGQCVDLGDAGPAFGPVTSVLRELVTSLGIESFLSAAGPGGDALRVLLPELGPSPEPGGGDLNRLHAAVTSALEVASRSRPVVVVVEDIQWADDATLKVLQFVLRTLTAGRVLVVLSYRTDDVPRGHPVRAFLSGLERSRRIVRIELGRLTREQVRHQGEAILGRDPDVAVLDRVFERSEGVPFFVEELLDLALDCDEEELPDTLRALLLARYERLSEPTQAVLRMIAVGGVRVRHELLATVFAGSAEQLELAAREAVGARVLVADEVSYSFRHALVREAVGSDLLPGERVRFHTRFAEELDSQPPSARVAAEVAYHWHGARNVPKAFPATLAAMAEALPTFAFRTAAQMGERALEMWDVLPDPARIAGRSKSELLLETAAALRNAGDGERALAFVDVALSDCPPELVVRRAELLREKAHYLANVGRPGSVQLLQEALTLLPRGEAGLLRAKLLSSYSARLMIEGRLREAITVARFAVAQAQEMGSDRHAAIATMMLGISRANLGELDAGLADLARTPGIARGDPSVQLRYLVNTSDLAYLMGRYDEALRIAEEGIVSARERGVERTSGVILASNAVDPLLALGQWDRAAELIERMLAFDAPLAFRLYVHRARIWLMLWRGDVEGAERVYRRWRTAMATLAEVEMQTRLGVARIAGDLALARGDLAGAWEQVEVMLSNELTAPGHDLPLLALGARVLAAVRTAGVVDPAVGEPELAAREARLRALLAKDSYWPTAAVWTAVIDAELGGPVRDGTDVAAWLAAVDAVQVPQAQAYLRAYALLRLAEARIATADRTAADRTAAVGDLRAAIAEADRMGAGLIRARATEVAARAGLTLDESAPRTAAHGSELTARERQVLELIGQGMSNRQIGERLFISAKTASVHVSAILRKLGASSRTEAVFRGPPAAQASEPPAVVTS